MSQQQQKQMFSDMPATDKQDGDDEDFLPSIEAMKQMEQLDGQWIDKDTPARMKKADVERRRFWEYALKLLSEDKSLQKQWGIPSKRNVNKLAKFLYQEEEEWRTNKRIDSALAQLTKEAQYAPEEITVKNPNWSS